MRRLSTTVALALVAGVTVAGASGSSSASVGAREGGPVTGSGAGPATYLDSSSDAQTVAFRTADALVPGDLDGRDDLYVRRGSGPIQLLTPGSTSGHPDWSWVKVLAGGDVAYLTELPLSSADLDQSDDLYLSKTDGSAPVLVSGSQVAPATVVPVNVSRNEAYASRSGSTLVFSTEEQLTPDDDPTAAATPDVYRYSNGVLTLVTPGSSQGYARGVSYDGARAYWVSQIPQPPETTDNGAWDLYQRTGTQPVESLTVTSGLTGPETPGEPPYLYRGESPDGGTVAVSLPDGLIAFRGGVARRVSPALDSGQSLSVVGVCDNGSVVFNTNQFLGSSIASVRSDLYLSTPTELIRMSPDVAGKDSRAPVALSADCSRLVWQTTNPDAAGDVDNQRDLFYSDHGSPAQVLGTPGPGGSDGSSFVDSAVVGVLDQTVLFTSTGRLLTTDRHPGPDVYQWDRSTGALSLITADTAGARGADLVAHSADDRVALVATDQPFPGDLDTGKDLYRYLIGPGERPLPAAGAQTLTRRGAKAKVRKGRAVVTTRGTVSCAPDATSCTWRLSAKSGSLKVADMKMSLAEGATARVRFTLPRGVTKRLQRTHRLTLRVSSTLSSPGYADVVTKREVVVRLGHPKRR